MTFRLKAASGALTGQTFDLDEETSIGSDEAADIRCEGLLPHHARIIHKDETLMLESAGDTWVNGQPTDHQPLQSGDELRLNRVRFVLQAPGLKPSRVLDQVEREPGINWKAGLIAALIALGGAAAIWWLLQNGAGAG